jgi:DNA-directed RNA polymerase specialized sigma24 family protein
MHCGLSAEDLATETLDKYLLSPNGLGWRENKGSLPAFLGTILRNRFIDYLRRERRLVPTEEDSTQSLPRTEIVRSPDDDVVAGELKDRLLELVKGRKDEKDLRDFIEASIMISSDGKVNQQLADLLGIDETEVVNRRKKLWRVAGVRDLFEEFSDGRERD